MQDPGVALLHYAAHALWFLGYPDQARKQMDTAFTLSQKLDHSYSIAVTLLHAAHVHQYRREAETVSERTQVGLRLAIEQDFALVVALLTILRGWALRESGQQAEGMRQMEQGLADCRIIGQELTRSYFLALQAEAYGKGGQAEEGLHVLAEALELVNETGEGFYEAEMYRLQGELTLLVRERLDAVVQQEAEECFLKALDVAGHQQARSLGLRAATSLARLWQQQGKMAEARELLAPVYNWFTEGFDTADLKDAKVLLAALS